MDTDLCFQTAYILLVLGMGFTTHNVFLSETLLSTDEAKNKIQHVSGYSIYWMGMFSIITNSGQLPGVTQIRCNYSAL